MTERLYTITHFEYVRDIGKNMVELYIIPDEDLLLYLHGIPKLEPQIYISLKGYEKDTYIKYQCNYYASVDSLSSFYENNNQDFVFTIFTNKCNIIYEYMSFPKSYIKELKPDIDMCNEKQCFIGSKNPPMAVYNPIKKKFQRIRKPSYTQIEKENNNWEQNACSHGVCKAEQTTEPPLLNSLIDISKF